MSSTALISMPATVAGINAGVAQLQSLVPTLPAGNSTLKVDLQHLLQEAAYWQHSLQTVVVGSLNAVTTLAQNFAPLTAPDTLELTGFSQQLGIQVAQLNQTNGLVGHYRTSLDAAAAALATDQQTNNLQLQQDLQKQQQLQGQIRLQQERIEMLKEGSIIVGVLSGPVGPLVVYELLNQLNQQQQQLGQDLQQRQQTDRDLQQLLDEAGPLAAVQGILQPLATTCLDLHTQLSEAYDGLNQALPLLQGPEPPTAALQTVAQLLTTASQLAQAALKT